MHNFHTTSEEIRQIIKSLNLTKTLYVSSIIVGEAHSGKKTLIRHLFPKTPTISARHPQKVDEALAEYDELVITDFERYPNPTGLDLDGKRIIATADYIANAEIIDNLFAFIYHMPSLRSRPGDVRYLKRLFIDEALRTLAIEADADDFEDLSIDLSENALSLRRSIYYGLVARTMQANMLEEALYHHLKKHLEGNNGYREHIGLFERPLIRAGLEKFGSQLKLSEVLGINRNTLRKKIHEHGID
jgi:DNA-binding protein Fis